MTRNVLLAGAAGALSVTIALGGFQFATAEDAHAVNPAPIRPAASAAPASFADIVQRVAPAVVSIDIEGKAGPTMTSSEGSPFDGLPNNGPFGDLRRFFQQTPQNTAPQPLRASGSGFFISPDGYIVTNNHVIDQADTITVRTADDRTLKAKLVGRDAATDLAVVKVEGRDFPFVSFEDRAKPRVGDWVVAVGNPFNLGGTATAGIVSALTRPNVSGSSYVDYMQIDAPINRGNSGGPTFDLYGRVVGVNSAIFSPSGGSVGIGFDIPADVAARVTRQLIADGKVTRGYLGATVQNLTPDMAEAIGSPSAKGALVADVAPGGPGARAGLQAGDLIRRVDDRPVTSAADLTRQVGLAHDGDVLRLDVLRNSHPLSVNVRSGIRPSEAALALNDTTGAPTDSGGLGLIVSPRSSGGLKIDRVAPGSDAARKGLQAGDVIEKAGGKPANSAADLRAAIDATKAAKRKLVLLMVQRAGRHIFLPLEIGGGASEG